MRLIAAVLPLAMVVALCGTAAAGHDIDILRTADEEGELTPVHFRIQGGYKGKVEISQVDSVRYLLNVEQVSGSASEYLVHVPAVFDHVDFNVCAGDVCAKTAARKMSVLSGLDRDIPCIFGTLEMDDMLKKRVAFLVVLQIVCVWALTSIRHRTGRAVSVTAGTVLFFVFAWLTLISGVREASVQLYESRSGHGSFALELAGAGCPWGGHTELVREQGILFPVEPSPERLFREDLDIILEGEGSRAEDIGLAPGEWKVFGIISPASTAFEAIDGGFVNMSGMDLDLVFLVEEGGVYSAGPSRSGDSIYRRDNATDVERLVADASAFLSQAAVNALKWRLDRTVTPGAVIGIKAPSTIIVQERN